MTLTRRSLLASATTLPAIGLLGPIAAHADGHSAAPAPQFRRFAIGDMQVTVLLAGTLTNTSDPQTIFGMNVDEATFDTVSRDAFLPTDASQFFFQPTVVQRGEEVILFDTGMNAEAITGVLAAAGYTPQDITHVVITHMHGDHVGGLMRDGAPTFTNAAHITGETEMAHWREAGGDTFTNSVAPIADQFELIGDGHDLGGGITSMAMFGHTPGHMGFRLSSGDAQALLVADMTNHYVWSLAYPDWEVRFDMDKEAAAATRRRVLGMLAEERIPMIGYHMPHPAIGFVDVGSGDASFRWVPESYQLML